MSSQTPKLSRVQVLEAFAMEPHADGETLQRYLREFPEYAAPLVDLSQEIFHLSDPSESPLSVKEQLQIGAAWSLIQSTPPKNATDPFSGLSVNRLREIAQALGVRRQVITAFRERTVIAASVPRRFIAQLAEEVGSNVGALLNSLSMPPQLQTRSYKADGKPAEAVQVTFEQLLRDTDLSDEQIKLLLADDT